MNVYQVSLANIRDHEFPELLGRVFRYHNFDSVTKEEWEQIYCLEKSNIMNLGIIRFQWKLG